MSEESKITFSSNGSGVHLKTLHGTLNFTTEEFSYYQNLYRIIDFSNEGNVSTTSFFLYLLLIRSNISHEVLDKLFTVVCGESPSILGSKRPATKISTANDEVATPAVGKDNAGKDSHSHSKGKNKNKNKNKASEATQVHSSTNHSENESSIPSREKLSFPQWLMLCKMIAYCQETNRQPSEKLFKSLHVTNIKLTLVDFSLGKIPPIFSLGEFYIHFSSNLLGWQVYGEDFSHQHVKYRISSRCALFQSLPFQVVADQLSLQHIALSDSSSNGSQDSRGSLGDDSFTILVERRYSEFEAFCHIMLKFYKGFVIPPLPMKSWTSSNTAERLLKQRSIEFQMFLDDLTSHPQLQRSFELICFLICSTNGFKSFVDLYHHIIDLNAAAAMASNPQSNGSVKNGMAKMFQDSTTLLANGANSLITTAKSLEFVNSLWGNITKTVNQITSPLVSTSPPQLYHPLPPAHHAPFQHLLHYSHEETLHFSRTCHFLDHVNTAAKAYEKLLHSEEGRMHELQKLASTLKTTSEHELQPDLVKILQLSHDSLAAVGRIEQDSFVQLSNSVSIPMNYLARYGDCFRLALSNLYQVQDQLIETVKEETQRKKHLENLQAGIFTTSRNGGGSVVSTHHDHANNNNHKNHSSENAWQGNGSSHLFIRSGYPDERDSLDEVKSREEEVNIAKLSLVEAENLVEMKKVEEADISKSVHSEGFRVISLQKRNIVNYLTSLVKEKIKSIKQSSEHWQALKDSLER